MVSVSLMSGFLYDKNDHFVGGKLVYIVSLSGLVSAFKIEAVQDVFETRLGSESASRQPTNTSQIIMKLDEKLEPIWTFNAENPVLSKPTIIFTVNHLIVATVCGDLFALNREGEPSKFIFGKFARPAFSPCQ